MNVKVTVSGFVQLTESWAECRRPRNTQDQDASCRNVIIRNRCGRRWDKAAHDCSVVRSPAWQDRSQASKSGLGLACCGVVSVLVLQIWSCTALKLQSLLWALSPLCRTIAYKKNRWPAVLSCLLHHLTAVRINSITSVYFYVLLTFQCFKISWISLSGDREPAALVPLPQLIAPLY